MKTIKPFFIILTGLLLVSNGRAVGQDIKSDLQDVGSHFTYRGKPIHPGLLQEFSGWISDSGLPTTISVDVAAPHRNEYSDHDVRSGLGKQVCIDTKNSTNEKDGGWFCYEWLGKLDNGHHVISTAESGGGSGVFESLFSVKFSEGNGYAEDGKKYKRLLMSIVRQYPLGDRDSGAIKVLKDRVVVGKSQYREKEITLT